MCVCVCVCVCVSVCVCVCLCVCMYAKPAVEMSFSVCVWGLLKLWSQEVARRAANNLRPVLH